MKVTERTFVVRTFTSTVRPDISSEDERDEAIIAWADENPHVWRIVTTSKSKVFGVGSSEYLGCYQRGKDPGSILGRLRGLKSALEDTESRSEFFRWRAGFTFEHFKDKGFTGGRFQLYALYTHEGETKEYPRDCVDLDYTPETLEGVIDHFLAWVDPLHMRSATRVTLDGKTVKEFSSGEI